MKKNLRIVSAAAAALLAVAPVAASAVSTVSAADTTTVNATNSPQDYSHINLGGSDVTKYVANVNPSFTLNGATVNADKKVVANGSLTGSVTANVGGVTATANLVNGQNGTTNVVLTSQDGKTVIYDGAKPKDSHFDQVVIGDKYDLTVNNVGFNFGANNAGKTVTLALPANGAFSFSEASVNAVKGDKIQKDSKGNIIAFEVKLDNNGTVNNLTVNGTLTAFDASNTNNVVFYNIATGAQASTGNAMLLADYNGQLNINSILNAVSSNYVAFQRTTTPANNEQNGSYNQNVPTAVSIVTTANEIQDQLEKAGIKVDAAGNFTAPHSFNVTVKATSDVNGKSAELPVTFTVANVAEPTVNSVSKRIMHNAYYYDKDAKRVGTDSAKRYESVNVLPNTTTISGKTYYQVVENGKAVDKYINAANIDGTKRTLKHNAYVYASSKKRANKNVLKKGEVITTYGASYTFKNGQKYYKIGDNTDKTYVKVANFR